LIPALKKEGRGRRLEIITPTAHPLEALATVLTQSSESVTATATLMDDLVQDPRALHLFLRRMTNDGGRRIEADAEFVRRKPFFGETSTVHRPLLVVDQFEELFTLCRDEFERQAFIDNLVYAVHAVPHALSLILTLRADFYAHLAQY